MRFTTFQHPKSLNVEVRDLTEWLHEAIAHRPDAWEKWSGPGFFPHVLIQRRYQRTPDALTGFVQFDLDESENPQLKASRSATMKRLAADPHCHFVATSFSGHGLWGLLSAPTIPSLSDFPTVAQNTIAPFAERQGICLDKSSSIHPFSFRLIPMKMQYISKMNRNESLEIVTV